MVSIKSNLNVFWRIKNLIMQNKVSRCIRNTWQKEKFTMDPVVNVRPSALHSLTEFDL